MYIFAIFIYFVFLSGINLLYYQSEVYTKMIKNHQFKTYLFSNNIFPEMKSSVVILLIVIISLLTIDPISSQTVDALTVGDVVPNVLQYIELPLDYEQTQANPQSIQLHPIKIKFQWYYDAQNKFSFIEAIKVTHVAAYYFSQVLQVQTIAPRQNTILTDYGKTKTSCYYFQNMPQVYTNSGFDPTQTDLVIFARLFYTQDFRKGYDRHYFQSGVCQLQRRPIYGIFWFQLAQDLMGNDANTLFQWNLQRTIHHLFHILGMNTVFFMKDALIDVSNFVIDDQWDTSFFKNPYTRDRKKQSQILRKNQENTDFDQYVIILKGIQQFIYRYYQCANKITVQQAGMPLQTVQRHVQVVIDTQWELRNIITSHFSNRYGIKKQISMLRKKNIKYGQAKPNYQEIQNDYSTIRISELSLIMLKETGFYEKVNINEKTKDFLLQPRPEDYYQASQYTLSTMIEYDICTLKKIVYSQPIDFCPSMTPLHKCDLYGQELSIRKTTPIDSQDVCQDYLKSCPKSFGHRDRCINIEYSNPLLNTAKDNVNFWDENCIYASCFEQNQTTFIRAIFQGQQYILCKQNEEKVEVTDGIFIYCPDFKEAFCNSSHCKNQCSGQGNCVNNKCIIPQTTPVYKKNIIDDQTSFISTCTDEITGKTYLCPAGCLFCTCSNAKLICVQPKAGFYFHSIQNFQSTTQTQILRCSQSNCRKCYTIDSSDQQQDYCLYCQQGFYLSQKDIDRTCLRCSNSQICTQCIGTGFGPSLCLNCLANYYLNEFSECKQCTNKQNCHTCKTDQNHIPYCTQCYIGYHLKLDKFFNQCLSCLPNCGKCDQRDVRICQGCFDGYFLNTNVQECERCSDKCRICESSTFCVECNYNYRLYQPGGASQEQYCEVICQIPCQTCDRVDPKICKTCYQGYILNSQTNQCQSPISKDNIACNADINGCQQCPVFYYLQPVSQLQKYQCKKCLLRHCDYCFYDSISNIQKCMQCQRGFYPDNFYKGCNQCPDQCLSCQNRDKCLQCKDGYTHPVNIDGSIFKQKCVQCTHNCLTCSGAPHQCLACKNGFRQIGNKCVPSTYQLFYTIQINANTQIFEDFILNKKYSQFMDQLLIRLQISNLVEHTLLEIITNQQKIKGHMGTNLGDFVSTLNTILNTQQTSQTSITGSNQMSSTLKIKEFLLSENTIEVSQNCLFYTLFDFLLRNNGNSLPSLTLSSTGQTYQIVFSSSSIQPGDENCQSAADSYTQTKQSQLNPSSTNTLAIVLGSIIGGLCLLFIIIIVILYLLMRKAVHQIQEQYEKTEDIQRNEKNESQKTLDDRMGSSKTLNGLGQTHGHEVI